MKFYTKQFSVKPVLDKCCYYIYRKFHFFLNSTAYIKKGKNLTSKGTGQKVYTKVELKFNFIPICPRPCNIATHLPWEASCYHIKLISAPFKYILKILHFLQLLI